MVSAVVRLWTEVAGRTHGSARGKMAGPSVSGAMRAIGSPTGAAWTPQEVLKPMGHGEARPMRDGPSSFLPQRLILPQPCSQWSASPARLLELEGAASPGLGCGSGDIQRDRV